MAQLKKGKAPGPDEITNEEILLLDDDNQHAILNKINQCWALGSIPAEWKHAHVVNIYKGSGDSSSPTRYRPISLLNVQYKLYARLIQTRIAHHMDHLISETQFGFRKGKSTGDPLHILRRVQELFESTRQPLYLLFLDWSMAFDKLSHVGLMSALKRFGLPTAYLDAISDFYTNPTFAVRDANNTSSTKSQGSGIRQGCPLSPYLFVIFLSVMMHDVKNNLKHAFTAVGNHNPFHIHSANMPLLDLIYADDILLFSRNIKTLQTILT